MNRLGTVLLATLATLAFAIPSAVAAPSKSGTRVPWSKRPPAVGRISPRRGLGAGGEVVLIHGLHLGEAQSVTFGGIPALSFKVLENGNRPPRTIEAIAPPGTGKVPVTVTLPSGSLTAPEPFSYIPPPKVNRLVPHAGPAAGGATVTIKGKAMLEATSVDFGLTPALTFTVVGNDTITAEAPPGTGSVDVTVTSWRGTSLTAPGDLFSYE
jgi:hypothetical protein